LDLRGRNWWETGENCMMWSFITCMLHQILLLTKSRRMSWVGHVASMEALRNLYKIVVGKPEGKRPFGDLGVNRRNGS